METAAVATDCLVALFSVSKSTLRGRLGSGARGGSCASSGSTRTRSRNSGDGGSREAFDPEAGPQRPRIETWEGAAVVIVAVAAMREAFGPGADAGQRGRVSVRTVAKRRPSGAEMFCHRSACCHVLARREKGEEAEEGTGARGPEGAAEGADPRRSQSHAALMATATTTLTCAPSRQTPRLAVVEAKAGASRSARTTRKAQGAWTSSGTTSMCRTTR